MLDDAKSIREKIERYRTLLQYNRDPAAQKVVRDMLREAEAQLKAITKPKGRDTGTP